VEVIIMHKQILSLSCSTLMLATLIFGCGGPSEAKSPDEQIEEDKAKLEDIEKEGGGEGTELDQKQVEDDLDAAEEEKAEEGAEPPAESAEEPAAE
jgi:hypothetical protein